MRLNPTLVTAAPAAGEPAPVATVVPYQPPLNLGEVVTAVPGALRGVDESTLLVVTGGRNGAYQVARLGGDRGRYFGGVARSALNPVPIHEVAERLAS